MLKALISENGPL